MSQAAVTRFLERAAALGRDRRPFAIATVVARRPPVSARLGDRALVFPDGRMEGFVGGACAREIVRRQALDALAARVPRLVSIRPDAAAASEPGGDLVVVPMTCASEGAVDVYVEPVVRARSLVVIGATPVADALARLGQAMRYEVVRVVDDAERRDLVDGGEGDAADVRSLDTLAAVLGDAMAEGGECAAVVASQGHYDEPALDAVLRARPAYAGLIASRKRGDGVRTWLASSGVPHVDFLRNPAGLDLGGRTPEEVALSVLAEIVQVGAGARAATAPSGEGRHTLPMAASVVPAPRVVAIDPVCHMEVAIEGARHTAEVDGTVYYFCCPGCRARFLKDPQAFLSPS